MILVCSLAIHPNTCFLMVLQNNKYLSVKRHINNMKSINYILIFDVHEVDFRDPDKRLRMECE